MLPPPPPPENDPADVINAKLCLGNFVIKTLNPTIEELQQLVHLAAQYVAEIDPQYPAKGFAYQGVMRGQPPPGMLGLFDTDKTLRGTTLSNLERQISSAISSYSSGANAIAEVVQITSNNPNQWFQGIFWTKCENWVTSHKKLHESLKELSTDIHYDSLRSFGKNKSFIPEASERSLEYFVRMRTEHRSPGG
jgi:hypothetical protein